MAIDKYGYRKYLRDKGFKDNQITYDNGAVKLNGKFFANATPEADGSTYNTRGNLDALYNAYKTQNMPSPKDTSNSLLNTVQDRLKQPVTPFSYNPYSDPQYQSALQAAQQAAGIQQGNTLARLRSMGQGKSSYSEGVAQQIGQQAVADVNARTLPQLMSQAYQRYMDQQNMGRQNTLDLLGLGNTYNDRYQQGLDNTYRDNTFAETQKQNNLDAALKVGQQTGRLLQPKQDYGLLYNQTDAPLNLQGQQFQSNEAQRKIENDRAVAADARAQQQLNATLANMTADNARAASAEARAAGNQHMADLFKVWENTGKAPAGIPGVAEGTPLATKPSSSGSSQPKIDAKTSADNYDLIYGDLQSDGVTKDKAKQLVQANRDYLSDVDYRKLLDYVNQNF